MNARLLGRTAGAALDLEVAIGELRTGMDLKTERSVYTPDDFIQWREAQALDLTPKFQRRGVWKTSARSFFVDTLLRSMPVPPIYLRVIQNPERKRIIREIVDGQQRIAAVLDFLDGKYRLARSLDADWGGKGIDELSAEERDRIRFFSFSAEVFHGISDLQVLEVFARLNTYSVPLNSQELRNGRWFGSFKQAAYRLAYEHLEFWRAGRIFSERNIARMLEVELTSELMIAQMAGMQDKKTTIDAFYAEYDDDFPRRSQVEGRFRRTVDTMSEALADELSSSEFRRPPLFYSLHCALYHRLYGLPGEQLHTPKRPLKTKEQLNLRTAVRDLSERIEAARLEERIPATYERFVASCLRQTDNLRPRQTRLRFLYGKAFS